MTDAFISDPDIIEKYELENGKSFEDQFSVVSIESILFFIVSTAVWLSFQMFGQHKNDISALLAENKAHRPQWYAMMARLFQLGQSLLPDSDTYDNTGLTASQIEASKIVKFAAAVQTRDKSILFIKIAREVGGVKQPLSGSQLTAFEAYMNEISDAGVRMEIRNSPPDEMRMSIDVYFDPLVLDNTGRRLDGSGETMIQDAIRGYLTSLPFNGMYTNQALIDTLQAIAGVIQAELKAVSSRHGNYSQFLEINARAIPYSGYYTLSDSNLSINFIPNAEFV